MVSCYRLVGEKHTSWCSSSYIYIGEYQIPSTLPCQTVKHLKDVVWDQIKSLPELESWVYDVDIEIKVYEHSEPPKDGWETEVSDILEECDRLDDDADVNQIHHTEALIVVFAPQPFRLIVFRKDFASNEYLADIWVTQFPARTVHVLEQAARNAVEEGARQNVDINVAVYEPRNALEIGDTSTSTSLRKLEGLITDDYLKEHCFMVSSLLPLEMVVHRECLIALTTLRFTFKFVLLERESLSYKHFGRGGVTVSHKDTVEVIERAAGKYIAKYLSREDDPAMEPEITRITVHDPTDSYEEAHNAMLGNMQNLNLDGDQLTGQRGLTRVLSPKTPADDIQSAELIVEFHVTRYPQRPLSYVLFERIRPEYYEYRMFGRVKATSKDTVGFIEDAIRREAGILSEDEVEVCVYKPEETFEAAYNKNVFDLAKLVLTDEDLDSTTLAPYKPSGLRTGQTLIATYRSLPTTREKIAEIAFGQLPPGEAVTCSDLKIIQNPANLGAILNGRPASLSGPPIEIYHPAFAAFIRESHVTDVELTPEIFEMASELISVSIASYEDGFQRRAALEELTFWRSIVSEEYALGTTSIHLDGSTSVHTPSGHQVPIQITELRNWSGEGGGDPIMQAERAYAAIFCSPKYEPIRGASCCPAILVGIAGPYLAVTGAIFGDRLTTQRLSGYVYLGPCVGLEGRSAMEEAIYKVSRVLHALEVSTKLLKDYYLKLDTKERLVPRGKDAIIPPHFRTFTTGGVTYELKYTGRIAEDHLDRVVFVATVEPATEAGKSDIVVVKFANSYCKAAHMLLSEISLAPRLWYCEEVESVGMDVVIMDFVRGEHARATNNDKNFSDQLRTAVKTLHDADFVHGDIRAPNVLITEDGEVKIIGFDRAGKAGEVRYPWILNMEIAGGWDPDVVRGGRIKKDHDWTMFRRLTGSELEVSDPPNDDR